MIEAGWMIRPPMSIAQDFGSSRSTALLNLDIPRRLPPTKRWADSYRHDGRIPEPGAILRAQRPALHDDRSEPPTVNHLRIEHLAPSAGKLLRLPTNAYESLRLRCECLRCAAAQPQVFQSHHPPSSQSAHPHPASNRRLQIHRSLDRR